MKREQSSLITDEKDAQVHDVGLRQAGAEQIAGGVKKCVRVVPAEKVGGIETEGSRPVESGGIADRAGGVGRAVFAVGAGGEKHEGERGRGGEGEKRRWRMEDGGWRMEPGHVRAYCIRPPPNPEEPRACRAGSP